MFTGIIQEIGKIENVEKTSKGLRISLSVRKLKTKAIRIGDSIAVNGTCLTVVDKKSKTLKFDIIPETLSITTLRELKKGDFVNLESSMSYNDKFDGHIVQGHVDGIGKIKEIKTRGLGRSEKKVGSSVKKIAIKKPAKFAAEFTKVNITCDKKLMKYIAKKGSVAVDGISLTVVDVNDEDNSFYIELIPHTLNSTTIGMKQKGDSVNIETDVLAKYTERLMKYQLDP